jgi:hypothetical protein
MRDNEKMPTNKEAEQIGYSLLKEVKTSETWYGRDVMEMAFEARSTPEYQEASNYLSSVNNERLARMGVQFGRNGMPIKDSSWDAAVIAVQQARENGELDF